MKKLCVATILAFILIFTIGLTGSAIASNDSHDAKSTKKEASADKKHKGESKSDSHEEEGKGGEHEEKAQGHGGGHETESAWRIPGWQTIFSVLAVGFFVVVSLNLLPKIAAKELEDHH